MPYLCGDLLQTGCRGVGCYLIGGSLGPRVHVLLLTFPNCGQSLSDILFEPLTQPGKEEDSIVRQMGQSWGALWLALIHTASMDRAQNRIFPIPNHFFFFSSPLLTRQGSPGVRRTEHGGLSLQSNKGANIPDR